jgi:predicted hydrocarbon binding protein
MCNFEKQWLHKLKTGLKKIDREDLFDALLHSHKDEIDWSSQLMKILNAELTEEEVIDVMCGCACLAPKDYLKTLREEYTKTKNLEHVHNLLQNYFLNFIKQYKNLSKEQLKYIVENDMGMAGTLNRNLITAVKIPKEFHEYFQTKDEIEKRYHYCHCPRIREALKSNEIPVDKNYCYCGAGFYRDIWEYILQRPVKVILVESIMQGDDFCKIEIHV